MGALILPIMAIVAMVFYLIFKVKAKDNENTPLSNQKITTNYNGIRKSVVIQGFGTKRLDVIKCVIKHTDLELKDAKAAVDNGIAIEEIPIDIATALVTELNELGASATLV